MSTPWLIFIENNTGEIGRLFVRAAAQQGSRPILLTADSSRYTYVREENLDVLHVNTQDEQALLNACRNLAVIRHVAGVTSCSEYFGGIAATLAHKFGLPGPRPRAIRLCQDKQAQRLRLRAAGIGIPAFRSARSVKAAVAAAQSMGYPVVVKPVTGTGSRGVKLCEHADDVAAHAEALLRQRCNERGFPIPRRILVEELAVGREYSVETFGRGIIGITEKHLGSLPYFVEVGHDYPAVLSGKARDSINQTVLGAMEALDLGWGPAHFELRLTAAGPKIIEVSPHLAGGYIPELVRLACGVDLVSQTIRLVIGRQPRLEKWGGRHASIRFILPPRGGTLRRVERLDLAKQVPRVIEVLMYARPGDGVERRGDFQDRIGHVIATGNSPTATRTAVERAHRLVRLIVEPDSAPATRGDSWRIQDGSCVH